MCVPNVLTFMEARIHSEEVLILPKKPILTNNIVFFYYFTQYNQYIMGFISILYNIYSIRKLIADFLNKRKL